ncbi:MAG: B12-binding domain-containing radical SAM protein [Phycisphaerae bacterium]|nr:B12-binding domain-containing radical SAM protein [Phycisphaerae bacterium]
MAEPYRILLIKPRRNEEQPTLMPPLGCMYLAAFVRRQSDVDVRIMDMTAEQLPYGRLAEAIRAYDPHVVGISALTYESSGMDRVASIAKSVRADLPVVVGGPHPSAYTQRVMENADIDYAVTGEGELTFDDLVRVLREAGTNGRPDVAGIDGLAFRENGAVRINPRTRYIDDLDSIPFPAWDLIPLPVYKKFIRMSRCGTNDYMVIFTTRSCPYKCLYCHQVFGKGFRTRSPENVLAEIRALHDTYGIRHFEIIDDIFNLDLPRAKRIFDMIVESGMKLRLTFPNGVRGDHLDEEFFVKAKRAGVVFMAFAVETASPRLQRKLQKNINLERIRHNISLALKHGIFCHGFFMLGFPTETRAELLATSDFAIHSDLHTANIFVVNPFEGTGLADWAKEIGKPVLSQFERNYFSKEFVNLTDVPDAELNRIRKRTVRRFFLSPRRAYRVVRDLPDKDNLWALLMLLLKRLALRSTG